MANSLNNGSQKTEMALETELDTKLTLETESKGTMAAQLDRDLIMKVAEVSIFAKTENSPENLPVADLRTFKKLSLMFVSRLARNAVLLQFRRMANLHFFEDWGLTLSEPVNLQDKNEHQVNKHFRISEWMCFWLLAIDVLRTKHLVPDAELDRSARMNQEELPAESLSNLILFRDAPISQARAAKWDLGEVEMKLDSVDLGSNPSLIGSFDRLLNLNARSVEIYLFGDYSDFVLPSMLNKITADRTEEFRLSFRTHPTNNPLTDPENFPHEYLNAIKHYVTDCCPNLKRITFARSE